jgi:hypothetical protein
LAKNFEPEWTANQILKIRQIYRKGGTVEDVMSQLGTSLEYEAIRRRALKLGMRFIAVKSNRTGDSKLVMSDG